MFAHRLNLTLAQSGIRVSATYYGEPSSVDIEEERFEGIACHRLRWQRREQDRLEKWGIAPQALEPFAEIVKRINPATVHFHGLSPNLSPDHIRVAKESGCRTVLTYHAPGQSCQRWDLLYQDTQQCDGRIEVERCTACSLRRLGAPSIASIIFSKLDCSSLAPLAPSRIAHLLQRREGTKQFASRWTEAIQSLDLVTYHSEWVRQLLRINNVSEKKLLYLPLPPPHDLNPTPDPALWSHAKATDRKLLYVGRLIDIKGVHVLLEAFTEHLQNEPLSLLIIGAQGPRDYEEQARAAAAKDPRVLLLPAQNEPTVMNAIAAADAVVVPSLWPETGPYTVLEALYLGRQVVGANRAGIAERLAGTSEGNVYNPYEPGELAQAITRALKMKKSDGQPFSKQKYESIYKSAVASLIAETMMPTQLLEALQ